MEITKNQIDNLNAELIIKVSPEDYREKVDKTLLDYRKKANIPGFRPGKTPMGMIKKRYEKSVLADELNNLINNSLYEYIEKNNLDILGNPIPSEDKEVNGDWDAPNEFEFTYVLGLAPPFTLKLSPKSKYTYYKVNVDDKLIDNQTGDLRRRYGKLSNPSESGPEDMMMGQFVELDNSGKIKEGGIMHTSTVSLEFIEDKNVQKSLIGLKVGDKIELNPKKVSKGEADMATMLGIDKSKLAEVSDRFRFTVTEIKRLEKAELNQEFFDKIFGKDVIKSEKEFRERTKKDLENMFEQDSKRILARDINDDLIENTKMNLPDAFLKRWILLSSKDENLTVETIEKEYDNYRNSLKWQLINNKIVKEHNLQIGPEEIITHTKSLLASQYAQYGIPAPEDKELEESAKKILSNREQANGIYEGMYEDKLTEFYFNTVRLSEKKISYEDFLKKASGEKKKK